MQEDTEGVTSVITGCKSRRLIVRNVIVAAYSVFFHDSDILVSSIAMEEVVGEVMDECKLFISAFVLCAVKLHILFQSKSVCNSLLCLILLILDH